jgi:RimJ/RimL family protein N-acetyltransferase
MHDRVGPSATELGYWIDEAYEGKGLVTEWCAAELRVAFEVRKLERVDIWCAASNTRSAAVPARLGFRHEATLRKRIPTADGSLVDTMIWTILADEFAATEGARIPVKAYDFLGRRQL